MAKTKKKLTKKEEIKDLLKKIKQLNNVASLARQEATNWREKYQNTAEGKNESLYEDIRLLEAENEDLSTKLFEQREAHESEIQEFQDAARDAEDVWGNTTK